MIRTLDQVGSVVTCATIDNIQTHARPLKRRRELVIVSSVDVRSTAVTGLVTRSARCPLCTADHIEFTLRPVTGAVHDSLRM